MVKRTIVASMGFTVDFLLRRINDLGRDKIDRIILVGLKLPNDPGSWERVEQSYNLLKTYLKPLQIYAELEVVVYRGTLEPQILDILAKAFAGNKKSKVPETSSGEHPEKQDCQVELYLSGGPRLLVTSMLVAGFIESLRHPDRNLCIVAYGEGFDAKYEKRLRTIINLMKLDEDHIKILEVLSMGKTRTDEILEETKMKRSTFYKKLVELREMGMIQPHPHGKRGRWKISSEVEDLIFSP